MGIISAAILILCKSRRFFYLRQSNKIPSETNFLASSCVNNKNCKVRKLFARKKDRRDPS